MTRDQKIAWIKRAIEYLYRGTNDSGTPCRGLCEAFIQTAQTDAGFDNINQIMQSKFGITKPKKVNPDITSWEEEVGYWFHNDDKGRATRLRIMRRALRKLQTPKK